MPVEIMQQITNRVFWWKQPFNQTFLQTCNTGFSHIDDGRKHMSIVKWNADLPE
jgi:hypothetical protein